MRRRLTTLGLVALALSCTISEIEPAEKAPPAPAKEPPAEPTKVEPTVDADAKAQPNKAELPEPKPPQEGGVQARIVEPAPAGVSLQGKGAGEPAVLRLNPKRGAKQTLELKMKMGMAMDIAVAPVDPKVLPEIRVQLQTKVESTSPIRYSFVVTKAERDEDPSLTERVLAAVDKAVEGLEGKKGSIEIDDRGVTKSIEIEIPDLQHAGLRPSLQGFRQAFSQFFVPLPQEPVAVGATWTAVTHFEQSGIPTQQTAKYKLAGREGGLLKIDVEFEQVATTATRKDVPGAEISVQEFGAEGSGKIEMDLSDIAPRVGEATSKSAIKTQVTFGGGGSQAVGMTLDLKLSLRDIAAK